MTLIQRLKNKISDESATIHKRWSVQLNVINGFTIVLYSIFPSSYDNLPVFIQDAIPKGYIPLIAVVLLVLSIFAQYVKQKNLNEGQK
jgi:hypothetical protein